METTIRALDAHTPRSPAEIISAMRLAQKMSLREFAAALGVSHNSVAQWENGVAIPEDERLTAWLNDRHEWIWRMALDIYLAKNRELIAAAAARQPQPA